MSDDIQAHVKVYRNVFLALAALTVITVAVSYIDMPFGPTVAVALAIAAFKASLVAAIFMHLKGEVSSVTWTLYLTAFFFLFVILIPLFHYSDTIAAVWDAWGIGG